MTIQLELSPETEAQLSAAANARGIPVETYAGRLLQEALAPHATGTGVLASGDIKEMTERLTEGSENMLILTLEANDRASYYEDRW
jgi:hypothetical protein